MKQIQTEQSENNSVLSSVVLTNRMGGNNVGLAVKSEFPKRVTSQWDCRSYTIEMGGKAVIKCSDSGMQQTWVQILVPHFVRFVRFLSLSEPSFPYLYNRNNNLI